jgi:hypothetical protein
MALASLANNVVISNISLVGNAGNFRVQFDLSWDNNWRSSTGQNNYDGVWVFFKYRTPGGNWQHLVMTGTSNSVPANYTAYQNSFASKTGAIIHRSNNFFGTTTLTDIELGMVDVQFALISGVMPLKWCTSRNAATVFWGMATGPTSQHGLSILRITHRHRWVLPLVLMLMFLMMRHLKPAYP